MSIYNNDTKIYPDLNPSAPQEPQSYRLNKLRHIFLMKLKFVNKLPKNKTIQYNHRYCRHSLITSTVITGRISIVAFASCVGLPVGIDSSGTSLLLSLATAITQKSFEIFTVKQEKHDAIKLLAQSKLDSITNIIS